MIYLERYLLVVLLLTISLTIASAQEKVLLTLHMKNGDQVSGYSDLRVIPFSTKYGSLTFPVSDIDRVELGVSTEGIDRDELYKQLDKIRFGAMDESERAFDRLVERDERILPFMRDYMGSPDYQQQLYKPFTVELVYQVLLEKYNLTKDFSEKDIIYFNGSNSISGKYKFMSIKLETNYGSFIFEKPLINAIEVVLKEEDIYSTKSFKLLADKHIAANREDGWMKTNVLVKAGDDLSITSEGEIILESLDGNTYTPDGGVNGSPPPNEKGPLFGNVVFKIGEKGAVQVAGASYNGKVDQTGILYFSIFESVYNSGNKGHYITKVKVNQAE